MYMYPYSVIKLIEGIVLQQFLLHILMEQQQNKKPLKTVWPDCKAATKFEKVDWEQA